MRANSYRFIVHIQIGIYFKKVTITIIIKNPFVVNVII